MGYNLGVAVCHKETLRNPEVNVSPIDIVVDTNVIIDGVYGYSSAAEIILALLAEGECRLVHTGEIRTEFKVISTGLRIGKNRWTAKLMPRKDRYFVNQLFREGLDVTRRERRRPTHRLPTGDQTDRKFVIAARKSHCACIVSSDHHLLGLPSYEGFEDITVLTPEQFLEEFGGASLALQRLAPPGAV